jgi:hypothetical protein
MLESGFVFMIIAVLMPGVKPLALGCVPWSQDGDVVTSSFEVRYTSGESWLRVSSDIGLGVLETAV